ncbi:hypothetical protein KBY24_07020 [Ruegeria pomeroyi]|nr:hypothetical protein [Ruegeria pomeroyi]
MRRRKGPGCCLTGRLETGTVVWQEKLNLQCSNFRQLVARGGLGAKIYSFESSICQGGWKMTLKDLQVLTNNHLWLFGRLTVVSDLAAVSEQRGASMQADENGQYPERHRQGMPRRFNAPRIGARTTPRPPRQRKTGEHSQGDKGDKDNPVIEPSHSFIHCNRAFCQLQSIRRGAPEPDRLSSRP